MLFALKQVASPLSRSDQERRAVLSARLCGIVNSDPEGREGLVHQSTGKPESNSVR